MTTMFRLATPDDSPALLAIYRPYVETSSITLEYDVPTQDQYRARVAAIAAAHPYIVHETDSAIDGYAYAAQYHEREGYRFNLTASVYLAPDAKRRGLGRALYRRLLPLLELQGFRQVHALITQPNAASNRLHEVMGFDTIALFKNAGIKFGKWIDVLHMTKTMGDFADNPSPPIGIRDIPKERIEEILRQS